MPAGSDIQSGLVLAGRYRVERRIGLGGTAAVFLADDDVLDRDVAVKRVHSDGTEDDARRLRREARIGASLTHPNLVMVYDTISAEDGVFIVMEFVDGQSLAELIGEHGLDSGHALPILRAVAEALDYAHRNGVVHRDVKPANVLIGHDGQVKLVDLGAAIGAGVTRVTKTHEVVGTLSYLAPERLAGESTGEPAGDIYSLAVLTLQTLAGRLPWMAASAQEQLARALHGAPDVLAIWPEASPELAAALERSMDPDPAVRHPTAAALIADVEDALAPAPVSEPTQVFDPLPPVPAGAGDEPPPPPAPRSATAPWWRRAAPVGLVAGALVAAAVAAAAIGGGDSSSPPAGRARSSTGGPGASTTHASNVSSKPASTTPTSSAATETSTPTQTAPPPSTDGSSGETLNAQGFALVQAGSYTEAIPILRQAVAELQGDPANINYAYALFNLGHALRLDGQPDAAIPILEERLKIPDQTDTVQAELALARAEAGEPQPSAPASEPKKAPKPPKEAPAGDEGD